MRAAIVSASGIDWRQASPPAQIQTPAALAAGYDSEWLATLTKDEVQTVG